MKFKIKNNRFLRHLAICNMKAEKRQGIYCILTIAIVTSILILAFNIMSDQWEKEYKKHCQEGQIVLKYREMQEENLNKIERLKDENIKWQAEYSNVGGIKESGKTFWIIYGNDNWINRQNQFVYEGKVPQNSKEIMVSEEFLFSQFQKEFKTGEQIDLDLNRDNILEKYNISGILKKNPNENEKKYEIYIGKNTAKELKGKEGVYIEKYVRLKKDPRNEYEALEIGKNIAKNAGISEKDVAINPVYMFGGNGAIFKETIKSAAVIIVLVLLMGALVINAIFSITVSKRVRVYAKMRTIGMTKQQIKNVIYKEQKLLLWKGSFCGIVIGLLCTFFMREIFTNLKLFLFWMMLSIAFVGIVVRITIRIPARRATKISPIEGMNYFSCKINSNRNLEKRKKLTPMYLGLLNIFRNKYKTIAIIISYTICGILIILLSTFGKSYSAERAQKFYFYPEGNFQINISSVGNGGLNEEDMAWNEGKIQSTRNPLTKKLYQSLMDNKNIKKITKTKGIYVNVERESGWADSGMQPVITEKEFETMKEKGDFQEGKADYGEILKAGGLMVAASKDDTIHIGDICKVSMVDVDGVVKEYQYPVMAIFDQEKVQEDCHLIPTPTYIFQKENIIDTLKISNITYCFQLESALGKEDEVKRELEVLENGNQDIEINNLKDSIEEDQKSTQQLVRVGKILLFIMFGFTSINLINTNMANNDSRKKEFGILRALGMNNKQLKQMIQIEEAILIIVPCIFSIFMGIPLSYFLCNKFDASFHCIKFAIPIETIILYIILLLIIQGILVIYNLKLGIRESVIEQLNQEW